MFNEFFWISNNPKTSFSLLNKALSFARFKKIKYANISCVENHPKSFKLKKIYEKLGFKKDCETYSIKLWEIQSQKNYDQLLIPLEILWTKEFTGEQRSSIIDYQNMPDKITSQDSKTSTNKWSQNNIGSLWLKSSQKGNFLSGKVTLEINGVKVSQNVIIFKNKFKEKGNQPDYLVFKPFDSGCWTGTEIVSPSPL